MNAVPGWLQIGMAVSGILAFLGSALAFIFVVWPAIRIQTSFIQRQEQKAVDKLLEDL